LCYRWRREASDGEELVEGGGKRDVLLGGADGERGEGCPDLDCTVRDEEDCWKETLCGNLDFYATWRSGRNFG
jgi:hypothetical protein